MCCSSVSIAVLPPDLLALLVCVAQSGLQVEMLLGFRRCHAPGALNMIWTCTTKLLVSFGIVPAPHDTLQSTITCTVYMHYESCLRYIAQ